MNTLISVIVPVYNAENWLHRIINSIKQQTYDNWELLLIDDGSIDKSWELCQEFANTDPRIHAFHQENSGPNAARNLGLQHASGEFITMPDADDEFKTEDTFEKNLQFMLEDDEIDIVTMPQYRELDTGEFETKKLQFIKKTLSDKREMFLNWYNGQIIDGGFPGKIFRKSVFNGWNLIETIRFTEDHYNIPDLCKRCRKLHVSGLGGYVYKLNPNSSIHSPHSYIKRFGQLISEVRICEYMNDLGNCETEEAEIYKMALTNLYYLQGSKYWDPALDAFSKLPKRKWARNLTRFQKVLFASHAILGTQRGTQFAKRIASTLIHG